MGQTPATQSQQTRHPSAPEWDGATVPVGQQPKSSKPIQADDLKKIDGIGPGLATTLQKLGTRTFIQIARWKPEDIEKIAKKLATDPERIKRENWVAGAKKQHYEKIQGTDLTLADDENYSAVNPIRFIPY